MAIPVPADIFELLPKININTYPYPGAIFPNAKFLDQFTVTIIFSVNESTTGEYDLIINNKPMDMSNINLMDLGTYGYNGTLSEIIFTAEEILQLKNDIVNDTFSNSKLLEEKIQNVDISNINCDEIVDSTDPNYTPNIVTTTLLDDQGNVIKTIKTDLNNTSKESCQDPLEKLKISILDSIPAIDINNNIPDTQDPNCILPEDSILTEDLKTDLAKVNVASDITTNDVNTFETQTNSLINNQLNKFNNLNGENINLDNYEENIKNELEDNLNINFPKYGMPLIVLNPDLNIIINIVDQEIQVLNISDIDSPVSKDIKTDLKIDINLHPGARIIPGIKYILKYSRNYNNHSLELSREYENNIYSDELTSTVDTGLFYLGVDKAGLKHFCGTFYHVQLDENKSLSLFDIINTKRSFTPVYGALAFYDFYNIDLDNTRIFINRVFPYETEMNPITMTDNFKLLDRLNNDYTFMNHGIIEDIFCSKNIMNTSFCISTWIKKHPYSNPYNLLKYDKSRQVLLADTINNNYLYYNENSKVFHIEFFNQKFKVNYELQNDIWYLITFKYNKNLNKLYLEIRTEIPNDLLNINKNITSFELEETENILDNKFQLTNIYGNYNIQKQDFYNKFNCVSGPIILHKEYQDSVVFDNLFKTQWLVLKDYIDIGTGDLGDLL